MQKRNLGIDILRFVCAFLVVCIHVPFPGVVGGCIKAVARIATPIFFMSTGYFLVSPVKIGVICNNSVTIRGGYRRLGKILKLIVLSNSFYFIIRLAAQIVAGGVVQYVAGLFSAKVMYELMLFNQSPFCEPLWYLNAVLYAVVSAILIQKAGMRKALYILTPILIAADLVLGKYSMFLFGRYFPNILTRNWLFFGLPNVAIGMAVRECDVLKKVGLHRRRLLILTVAFLIGLIIEQLMLTKLGIIAERDNYIFAVLMSVTAFLLFANITAEGSAGKQLARLGQMTSTGIYIIHPFFIMALPVVLERISLTGVYNLSKPVFVFTASLVATVLYNNMKERISKRLLL